MYIKFCYCKLGTSYSIIFTLEKKSGVVFWMKLTHCKSAVLHKVSNDVEVCKAKVVRMDGDESVLLFDERYIDNLDSEADVTFLDEVHGLVSYRCSLSNPKKNFESGKPIVTIDCHAHTRLSALERRDDYKINVKLPLEIKIPIEIVVPDDSEEKKLIRDNMVKGIATNLSAGGIYVTSLFKFPSKQDISIRLSLPGGKMFDLTSTILRVDEISPEAGYGYGCKFKRLSSSSESAIRNFVFKRQMERRQYFE